MSDSIQPIRYNSQLKQIKRKDGKSGRNDKRKEEKEFLCYVSEKGKEETKAQKDSNLDYDSIYNRTETGVDTHEDNEKDSNSGTILDIEV